MSTLWGVDPVTGRPAVYPLSWGRSPKRSLPGFSESIRPIRPGHRREGVHWAHVDIDGHERGSYAKTGRGSPRMRCVHILHHGTAVSRANDGWPQEQSPWKQGVMVLDSGSLSAGGVSRAPWSWGSLQSWCWREFRGRLLYPSVPVGPHRSIVAVGGSEFSGGCGAGGGECLARGTDRVRWPRRPAPTATAVQNGSCASELKWESVMSPGPRVGPAMAYDAVYREVILFGGYNGSAYLGDTWEFFHNQWVELTPLDSPSPRDYGDDGVRCLRLATSSLRRVQRPSPRRHLDLRGRSVAPAEPWHEPLAAGGGDDELRRGDRAARPLRRVLGVECARGNRTFRQGQMDPELSLDFAQRPVGSVSDVRHRRGVPPTLRGCTGLTAPGRHLGIRWRPVDPSFSLELTLPTFRGRIGLRQ